MASELDRLERQAQETRGQLALDLDELMLRLKPRHVVREVAGYARRRQPGAGLGRLIVRDMRHNPIPYLLIGIGLAGLGWAMASASATRARSRLPQFTDADFVPPPSVRPAVEPAAPPRATPATPAPRETSPVTPALK